MKKLGLFVAGTAFAAAGIVAIACSDNTGSSSGLPVLPDGGGVNKDTGTTGDTGGGGGDTGTDANCFARLRPSATNGVFCPNLPRDGGAEAGRGGNCAPQETCCNGQPRLDGGFDLTTCSPQATGCEAPSNPARSVDFYECTEKNDCVDPAAKCCIIGFPRDGGASAKPTKITDQFTCSALMGEFGTRCQATCGATDFQGCQANSDCEPGQTCKITKIGPSDRIEMGICE